MLQVNIKRLIDDVPAIPAHSLVASTYEPTGTICGQFTRPLGAYAGCMRLQRVMRVRSEAPATCVVDRRSPCR